MTITPNPTDARLKFVWDKQKPQVDPRVMMDVIAAVADRVAPVTSSRQTVTWADRIEDAGRKADPRFVETFDRWRHSQTGNSVPGEFGWIDAPFVDAVVALVTEMPEFKKASPIDGLVPWFAKEMNRLFLLSKDANAPEYPAYYDAKYARLQQALGEDPVLVEWVEKKKPNLSKLKAEELLDEVEAFEQDRQPEVVYKFKDGSTIVKLATRTQIQKEGEALANCLRKDSSHTEGYCKLAESGKSAFYSLRAKDGDSVLSIQWTPGEDGPEQVLGKDNRDPEEDEADLVAEWVKSEGGTYEGGIFYGLSRSERRIAEAIVEECRDEDRDGVRHMTFRWDELFAEADALEWIRALGCRAYEEARIIQDAGLDYDQYKKVLYPVREYIENGYTKDAGGLLPMGLLAGIIETTFRQPRPILASARVPEGQERLPFESPVFEQRLPPEPKTPEWPRGLELTEKEAKWLAVAKEWIDEGWSDEDYFDDAALWWANWFSAEEAFIFTEDMAEYDRANKKRASEGVPLEMAIELRDMGISAHEALDAATAAPRTVDITSVESVAAAVEENRERLRRNKGRRYPEVVGLPARRR